MTDGRIIYLLFARRPEAGKVKRRLAEEIGAKEAAELYSAFLGDILAAVRQTGRPFAIGCTPAAAVDYFRSLAPDAAEVFAQEGGDLGERMSAALEKFFRLGWGPIVLVGSDIPLLSPEILCRAGDELMKVPAVLGPARDGGYYLIGLDRVRKELFAGPGWGGGTVLEETRRILEQGGVDYRLLPPLTDIDTAADLERLKEDLGTGGGFPRFTRRALLTLPEETRAAEPGSGRRAEAGRK